MPHRDESSGLGCVALVGHRGEGALPPGLGQSEVDVAVRWRCVTHGRPVIEARPVLRGRSVTGGWHVASFPPIRQSEARRLLETQLSIVKGARHVRPVKEGFPGDPSVRMQLALPNLERFVVVVKGVFEHEIRFTRRTTLVERLLVVRLAMPSITDTTGAATGPVDGSDLVQHVLIWQIADRRALDAPPIRRVCEQPENRCARGKS